MVAQWLFGGHTGRIPCRRGESCAVAPQTRAQGLKTGWKKFMHPGKSMGGWIPIWSPGLWMHPAICRVALEQK